MSIHRPAAAATCTLLLLASAAPAAAAEPPAGAGAAPAASGAPAKNRDPFQKVNRATHAFNDALDRMLLRPAARAYRAVVPEGGRKAVSNFVTNLEYPTTLVNNLLQGKFGAAGTDTLRFVVNTTIGLGGLADPASALKIPAHDEDFGQTLGYWGVPSGPYLVLPFLGPSNLRDAPGRGVDRYTNARRYLTDDTSTEFGLLALDVLDTRAELLSVEGALRGAFDPYALVRDAYLQRREYLVTDGNVPEESYEDDYELPEEIPVDAPTEPAGEAGSAGGAVASPEAPGAAPEVGAPGEPADADAPGEPADAGAPTETPAMPPTP